VRLMLRRYDDAHHRHVRALTSDVQHHGYNVMSVGLVFAHNSTKKSRRSTAIGRKAVRATADIAHQFKGQKVRGQGHQTVNDLGQVTGDGAIFWWPPAQFFPLKSPFTAETARDRSIITMDCLLLGSHIVPIYGCHFRGP